MIGGRRFWFAWFSFAILLLLHSAKAETENKTEPTDNVNLSPFQIWRSTLFCFQKALHGCTTTQKLNITGRMKVSIDEADAYCDEGCKDHTLDMLQCLSLVNRHLKFNNNATVPVITKFIKDGCDKHPRQEISTMEYTHSRNSAIKVGRETYMSFVTSLSTMALIAIFNK